MTSTTSWWFKTAQKDLTLAKKQYICGGFLSSLARSIISINVKFKDTVISVTCITIL